MEIYERTSATDDYVKISNRNYFYSKLKIHYIYSLNGFIEGVSNKNLYEKMDNTLSTSFVSFPKKKKIKLAFYAHLLCSFTMFFWNTLQQNN